MNTPATENQQGFTFEDRAESLGISPDRWNEPLVQMGIALLNRAESLQLDLSTALDFSRDGVTFGREEMLMRVVCAMLQDKLTRKNENGEYIREKMAAIGFEPIKK